MAKKKVQRRRRQSKGVNIVNGVEAYLLASAGTLAIFGTDLASFATQGWLMPKSSGDNGLTGAGSSWSISASELINGMFGGNMGMSAAWEQAGLGEAIKRNMRTHGGRSLVSILAIPPLFSVGKKLMKRPISATRKILKDVGLNDIVKV